MSKFIKQLHDLIDAAISNGLISYQTRDQIDDAIDQGQMTLYRRLVKKYKVTKDSEARNLLLPFEKSGDVAMSSGRGTLPSDLEHDIEAYVTVSSVEYPVYIKEPNDFREQVVKKTINQSIAKAGLNPVTTVFGMIYAGTAGATATKKIQIYPPLPTLSIRYWIRPPKPDYATTASSGQYIYSDSSSTDVSWSAIVQDILIENTYAQLGLGLRDGMVQRAGQKSEPKEISV